MLASAIREDAASGATALRPAGRPASACPAQPTASGRLTIAVMRWHPPARLDRQERLGSFIGSSTDLTKTANFSGVLAGSMCTQSAAYPDLAVVAAGAALIGEVERGEYGRDEEAVRDADRAAVPRVSVATEGVGERSVV